MHERTQRITTFANKNVISHVFIIAKINGFLNFMRLLKIYKKVMKSLRKTVIMIQYKNGTSEAKFSKETSVSKRST